MKDKKLYIDHLYTNLSREIYHNNNFIKHIISPVDDLIVCDAFNRHNYMYVSRNDRSYIGDGVEVYMKYYEVVPFDVVNDNLQDTLTKIKNGKEIFKNQCLVEEYIKKEGSLVDLNIVYYQLIDSFTDKPNHKKLLEGLGELWITTTN